ncbi:hypothetical protein DL93DRAFT_2234496 [Clavulina sp. PMI_390]|nr:hypothetical protein DL93DRAFT_2234496 [Clavulina sp. PMI_390]
MALLSNLPHISFAHVKSHTSSKSTPSLLNDLADRTASDARSCPAFTPTAPKPSFFCDAYSVHSVSSGHIESDLTEFILSVLQHRSAYRLACSSLRMSTALDGTHSPPTYPYTHAYSALVQLQTRSGQLATASTLSTRGMISSMCRRCGRSRESVHHIFVDCHAFASMHEDAAQRVVAEVNCALESAESGVRDALVTATSTIP